MGKIIKFETKEEREKRLRLDEMRYCFYILENHGFKINARDNIVSIKTPYFKRAWKIQLGNCSNVIELCAIFENILLTIDTRTIEAIHYARDNGKPSNEDVWKSIIQEIVYDCIWKKELIYDILFELTKLYSKQPFYGKEVIEMYRGGKRNGGVDWDYFDKFNPILDKYMEFNGDGKSKASQIVTAVNKLIYKWYNNGDIYNNIEGNQSMGWFNDLSPYANWLYENTDDKVKDILDRIYSINKQSEYEILLKELADRCMDFNYLEKFEDVKKVGSIYKNNGKFKFLRKGERE